MTSDLSQINSFVLSNMAPQYPKHNRNAWKNWEMYTRSKAEKMQYLLVITGVTGSIKTFVKKIFHNRDVC